MPLNPPTIPGGRARTDPRQAKAGGAKRSGINDLRRSTCSRCGYGIFAGQAVQWSRDPMGLVHVECPE